MKKALVVIDMQNDYFCDYRKKQFTYNAAELVGSVNDTIHKYKADGCEIVYIRHLIQNIWTNRKLFGFSIAGTEGAELYTGLDVVSDNIFDKMLPDSFTADKFRKFISDGKYDGIVLCGIDECGCVQATAKGGIKAGLPVELVAHSIGSKFPEAKVTKTKNELISLGVKYI